MELKYVLDPKELPKSLYKFRDLKNPNHQRMLANNELFLTSPSKFNDPFDSTIPVCYDDGTREEIITYWMDHLNVTQPDLLKEEREKEATKVYDSGLFRTPKAKKDMAQLALNYTYKTIGVFSLSANLNSILLWSYYANEHRGFCVEFDTIKLFQHCVSHLKKLESQSKRGYQSFFLRDVKYAANYPIINAYRTTLEDRTLTQLLTKSIDWKHEDEYRLVWFYGANKKINVDNGTIKSVIMGCQMEQADQDDIKSILKTRSDRIPLFRGRMKSDSFGLDFEPESYP